MAVLEQKEKIIRYYKGTEGEEAAVRLVDMAEQTERSQKFRLGDFLDPYGQEIAETVANNYPGLRLDLAGGYVGAERQRAMFIDKDFGGSPSFELACVKAVWNGQFEHIGHRDVLGAVMGLGFDRSRLGDIIMGSAEACIVTDQKLAEYLIANLTQIGHTGVKCEPADLSLIPAKEEKFKELRATVASLRVDSIAAAGYGISRSKAAADIAADKLKLNWQPVKNASQNVKEGDTMSLRGRGRLEIAEVRGQTKKGRIGILLKRYY
ncbi:MAG: YlmH/Sll1252 family protein [Anaerovibrio sp.]|nr:YlmH/Sll1252 family protein [Anaerovibrio sp.]